VEGEAWSKGAFGCERNRRHDAAAAFACPRRLLPRYRSTVRVCLAHGPLFMLMLHHHHGPGRLALHASNH
jgi:hypothetical protein